MEKIFKVIGDGSVSVFKKTYDSGSFFIFVCAAALIIGGIILLSNSV